MGEFLLPAGTLPAAKVEVKAFKPSWEPLAAHGRYRCGGGHRCCRQQTLPGPAELQIKRAVTPAFWIATIILLLVYLIISFEWMHRTLAALLGAALILFISYTLGDL